MVNNAILLVHQTRAMERHGLARRTAVTEAVGMRLWPILMSTLTSIFGMLPLLLIPGAVSGCVERGLAAVIIGGMCVSAAFTLILLPSLLRIGEGASRPAEARAGEPVTVRGIRDMVNGRSLRSVTWVTSHRLRSTTPCRCRRRDACAAHP